MNNSGFFTVARMRLILFAAVAALHITLIMVVVFHTKSNAKPEEPSAGVMKLVDVQEELPPPPPPEKTPVMPQSNTQESIAETMLETEEPPPPVTAPVQAAAVPEVIEYLPQNKISHLPELPEAQIIRSTVYPPIAQRANVEGIVFLELFIDRQGNVRQVNVLKEDPPGYGFGEAAANAFKGIKGKPADANGVPVAVRYRRPVRFTLK